MFFSLVVDIIQPVIELHLILFVFVFFGLLIVDLLESEVFQVISPELGTFLEIVFLTSEIKDFFSKLFPILQANKVCDVLVFKQLFESVCCTLFHQLVFLSVDAVEVLLVVVLQELFEVLSIVVVIIPGHVESIKQVLLFL